MSQTRLLAFAVLAAWAAGSAPRAAAALETRVTILQTTDLHDHAKGAGHTEAAAPALGGYPRIAAYVEHVRAHCGNPVLLVDSGDWSMGTVYDLTLGRMPLALRFADALRYDCITLGNHEFDNGSAGLAGVLGAARRGFHLRSPILASNLELNGDTDLAPFLGPGKGIARTLVKTLPNGLRVGFLGLMGRDAAGDASAARPVRFADYGRDPALVQGLVDRLRGQEGCRLVLALDHAGINAAGDAGEDVDLARRVTGIDVIASGHMHRPLGSARTVANGAWSTLILCAGAYGANVSRLDLAFPAGNGRPRLEVSENLAMTDAALAALEPPARPDPAFVRLLERTDLDLNRALAPVFTRVARFGDYAPDRTATGLYHPVAACAQGLAVDEGDAPPAPGGLGDLCADAMRAVANGLSPPGRSGPPFTAAVLAAGELRGGLESGAPITFADLYGLLPLGLSPDPAQAGLTGEPLVSAYMDTEGLRALCAMQLLAQAGLVAGDEYFHLSGLGYALRPAETAALFATASAVTALTLTRQRAEAGSAPAGRALAALAALASDRGAALRAAMAAGNPYAGAMVRLADPAREAGNLVLLGQVAAGSTGLERLVMAQALAAIGPLWAFAPADPACTGPAVPLGPGRHRLVLDLFLLTMIDRSQGRFGLDAPLYQAAQGDARLGADPAGLQAALAHRLDLDPGGPFQEVKGWMAPILYLGTPHFSGGRIGSEYHSSPFQQAGAALRTRNAAYPLGPVAALAALARTLRQAP